MAGALVLGYFLSQALLPAFIGTSNPPVTGTTTQNPTQATSNNTTTPTSPGTVTEPTSNPASSDPDPSYEYEAKLPMLEYFQIQLMASSTYAGASAVMNTVREENFPAEVALKGAFYTVQVGAFGDRDSAYAYTEILDEAGFTEAFVTDWVVTLWSPRNYRGEEARLKEELAEMVGTLASAVIQILEGRVPAAPQAGSPEGLLSQDDLAVWQETDNYITEWINNTDARNPSLVLNIIINLRTLYSWFE